MTMNISLSDTLQSFVDDQANQQGLNSSSEYVQALICKEQARLQLRGLLMEGAESAQTTQANQQYFDSLRRRVSQQ
ncbi:MAG: antitoxin ParD1/3/4 [Phenylobacterium sp.]|jgi:antitoxin ParD1/3/4